MSDSAFFYTGSGNNRYKNVNMLSGMGANCYVIRCMEGDVLIDTGVEECRDEIEVWLQNYKIKLIVLTHGHNDHIGNAAYFSELYGVPIAMSRYDIPLIRDNLCRKSYDMGITAKPVRPFIEKNMKKRADFFKPDIILEDGDKLYELGVDEVLMRSEAVVLDGHTRGSVGILDGGDLYCGDALCGLYGAGQPPIAESPRAEMRTLRKIAALAPERIFPGHGEPIIKGDRKYLSLMKKYGKK